MGKKKGGLVAFAAGGVAGVTDTCFTMPLDTIKTAMQIQGSRSPIGMARNIVSGNGVRGLYAGFAPFAFQAAGKAAIRFYAYELVCQFVDMLGIDRAKNPNISALGCGMLAGVTEACLWTQPSERIKVMQQAAAAGDGVAMGSLATAKKLVAEQGFKSLYVGTVPTALRQSSSVAIRFCLYENIRGRFESSGLHPSLVSFLAGGTGGAISVIANNPIDIIKSKVQSGAKGTLGDIVSATLKERGVMILLDSSLQVRVPRLFLSQAIQFTVVDALLTAWGKR